MLTNVLRAFVKKLKIKINDKFKEKEVNFYCLEVLNVPFLRLFFFWDFLSSVIKTFVSIFY